ncbi:MAG: ADP-ribosylglycohydrolase family protein, partial [Solirubrobacterales bacterium]
RGGRVVTGRSDKDDRKQPSKPHVIDSGREIRQTSYSGAMLGLAVGDALGTTLEFAAPGSFEPLTDMVGGGPFDLPAGAWTDDTSMALCLADSLIERRAFDPIDQLERYVRWWREGHNSSIGRCFDIGGSTFRALDRFEQTGEPFPGDADPNGAGNAPLMRLAPIPLLWAFWPHRASQNAVFSARTTHGDPRAADAASLLCLMMITALFSRDKDEVFMIAEALSDREGEGALHPEVAAVGAGSFREKEPPEIVGTGFVIEALEAALWALHSTSSWEEGALAAVNLGNDADTTGAIYGQLAGAIYGVEAIPTRWLDRLVMREEIEARGDALFFLSRDMMEEMTAR